MTDPTPAPDPNPTPEAAPGAEPPGPRNERWVFVFLALLVGFNLFIFFGSRDSSSRPGGAPPPGRTTGPGPATAPRAVTAATAPGPASAGSPRPGASSKPPAPPAPVGAGGSPRPAPTSAPPAPPPPGAQPGPRVLAGPELILGVVALKGNKEAPLTADQAAKLPALVERLEPPQVKMQELAVEALGYLTLEQAEWIRMNRGPAQVAEGDDVEPGMDPVTSAAWRVLQEKAKGATGTPAKVTHENRELQFHDILNGTLKLDQAGPDKALTPDQAKALLPLVQAANQARQEENAVFDEIYGLLEEKQIAWLEAHKSEIRADVNALILRYARLSFKS